MSFLRFLRNVTDSFFKWWWAALTGVASVLSWFGVPADGVMVSRAVVAVTMFVALGLVFLVFTVTAQSYDWFLRGALHPRVVRVVPEMGGKMLFVIRAEGRPLAAGHLLAVHRDVAGAEVCMAVLRFDRARQDGEGDQCETTWISAGHQRDLVQGKVAMSALHIRREIPADAIDRITKGVA